MNLGSEEDTFKILLATDCHLGYQEKDPIRGDDSLNTFDEILSIGKKHQVDFILLGGDLFHVNRPSRSTLLGCLNSLRKHCLGDKPIQFEILSDQCENFKHSAFPVVNYSDPNYNVAIPVFSIHGNHDEPSGKGNYCSLDILSTSGLVNYFGRSNSLEEIVISPLLFQKGQTKLALFGLGSIRDERLHRLFREGKVTMLRPKESKDDWFNLFTIHQNRARHGATNYIPEQFLDSFLDLVFWGHEHECRIKPEENTIQKFFVTQPGSPIATSLSPGEEVQKKVGILYVHKKQFRIEEVPLQTVRQFYFETVDLNKEARLDLKDPNIADQILDLCCEKINTLLLEAEEDHTGNPRQPSKPLIRLRVEHTGKIDRPNPVKLGQRFIDKVANPNDLILFKQRHLEFNKKDKDGVDMGAYSSGNVPRDISNVEALVTEHFKNANENGRLTVLSETGMELAIKNFIAKEEIELIVNLIDHQMKKLKIYLNEKKDIDIENLDAEILTFRDDRERKKEDESQEILKEIENLTFNASKSQASSVGRSFSAFDEDEDDLSIEYEAPSKKPRRGARSQAASSTSRASTRGRGRGRGRGKAAPTQETIMSSFQKASARSGSQASWKSAKYPEDEVMIENDSDDEDSFQPSASSMRSTTSTKRSTASSKTKPPPARKGAVYDSDSDDDGSQQSRNPFSSKRR